MRNHAYIFAWLMTIRSPSSILIIGAGAAGLMAARELARAGKQVTMIEARDRTGGRIFTLPAETFGYPAEGGAEFVHGEAIVTRALLHDAGLSLAPMTGMRWDAREDKVETDAESDEAPDEARFHRELAELAIDMPIAAFLDTRFGGPAYAKMRRDILRMVEGYDAADPKKASTFALREEWMGEGVEQQGRVKQGYGAMIDYLAADARRHGAVLRLNSVVKAIGLREAGVTARLADGSTIDAEAAILTVPLPLLAQMELPAGLAAKQSLLSDIGFGNVVKVLLRFKTPFWTRHNGQDFSNLSFLFGDGKVPTWWTQHPGTDPVLTGWYAGPKADTVAALSEQDLIAMGLSSLVPVFKRTEDDLRHDLVAARAINWGNDPLACGAYSYATPQTRAAQVVLQQPDGTGIHISGEALYAGRDMGTVEAALASGRDTARMILASSP